MTEYSTLNCICRLIMKMKFSGYICRRAHLHLEIWRDVYYYLMPRVCFKPITLYIEMHHVRTFFFCMASWLFRTACCSFTTCSSPRKTFTGRFASKKPLRIFLIIFYLQLLNSAVMLTVLWQTKTTVASPLEDKHLVSRHHVIRSEKVVTPHKKNHLTWCFSRYHVIGLEKICLFQSVTLKAAKKNWGIAVHWEE